MQKVIGSGKKETIVELLDRSTPVREYTLLQNAHLKLILIVPGATSFTSRIVIRLTEQGAEAHVVGFMVGRNQSSITLQTLQHHSAPGTVSNLLVKSVLSGDAKFTYDGIIRVEQGAQKADAYQRNENLLLSAAARVASKPSLEILANDVRCTHAATVSALPEDQLWYLATRGIKQQQAKQLIVDGFFERVLADISDTMVAQEVRERLWQIL